MEIFNLFVIAFMPVLKVLLLTALGLFLALERIDILGAVARKHLNDISFFVFNPALVGSSLAKNITAKSMRMLWFMPFNILITFIIGSALGWIVLKITKAPRDLWGLVLGCCSAGNLGNMLFIIIPAVCKEKGSPFGDVGACYNKGIAYSALSMAIGSIYLWSYVYNIVRIYSSNNSGQKQDDFTENVKSVGETTENLPNFSMEPPMPLNGCPAVKVNLNHFEIDCTASKGKTEVGYVPPLEKIKPVLQTFATKMNLRKLFAPSTIAAIVAFMVGILPPFRKVLIGEHAALRVIEDSLSLLGDAAIPTVSLIVGANLLRGLKGSRIHLSLIIGIIMIRYIALPLLGLVVVKCAIRFGLVKSDPLYQFVLLLQFALPPAINIGTMTQLFGAGETECSVIMLWTYALATISLTFWTAFYMWFLKEVNLAEWQAAARLDV